MLDFERNAGDNFRAETIPAASTRIFADLLLECHRNVGRHYWVSFKFSQGRQLVASPFEQRIRIRFTEHVTVGFLIQSFQRSLLYRSNRARSLLF